MAKQSNRSQVPGEILRLEIPLTVSAVLIAAVAVFTIFYALWEDARPTIKFLGAAIGVAAGVLSAYYVGRALKISIEQRDQAIIDQKIERSFGFAYRWNDPKFVTLRAEWRELLKELEAKSPDQVCDILESDNHKRTVAVGILNFFEEMCYASRSGVADAETLKNILKTITVRYYSAFQPWIEKYRKDRHQGTAYEHFEWLWKQWKSS